MNDDLTDELLGGFSIRDTRGKGFTDEQRCLKNLLIELAISLKKQQNAIVPKVYTNKGHK